jgi:uncharacterized membrane protein
MFRKDLVAKSLIWRFAIAIPVGTAITYFWIGSAVDAIECSLFGNFIGTILYYTYDILWDKYLGKIINTK